MNFVFDLFDQKGTGKLSKTDVRLLLQTAVQSMRQLTPTAEVLGSGTDGSAAEAGDVAQAQDTQWVEKAQLELLSSSSAAVTLNPISR